MKYLKYVYKLYPVLASFPEYRLGLEVVKKYNCRSVLDVGCGSGNFFAILPQGLVDLYVGIDSENVFKVKHPRATFVWADAWRPPEHIVNTMFDCVFFINSLFYIGIDVLDVYKHTGRYLVVVDLDPGLPYLHMLLLNIMEGGIRQPLKSVLKEVSRRGFTVVEQRKLGATYCIVLRLADQQHHKNNI